jgi:hypothetical protein
MTNWKDAGSGIILWGPTARVEVDVTDRTSLRLSVGTDNMEGEFYIILASQL